MAFTGTAAQLAAIRDEVGDNPDDDAIEAVWQITGEDGLATAISILSRRRAKFVAAAADLSIPNQIRVNTSRNIDELNAQIAKLQAWAAADAAGVDRDAYIPGLGTLSTFDIDVTGHDRLFGC